MIVIAVSLTGFISAQTSDEWLRQKKTEKKYLFEQITALKAYSNYVSKGYSIVKNGLNTVQHIKQGDLSLHTNYFISLISVDPKIKKYARVADIISIQKGISKQTSIAIRNLSGDKQFTSIELRYLENVLNDLLGNCAKNLDELFNLITNGGMQMKHGERIQAIDKLYADMLDKKVFITSFCNDAVRLSTQRANEEKEVAISKKLNDIK